MKYACLVYFERGALIASRWRRAPSSLRTLWPTIVFLSAVGT
jgi:hypothetical protein